MRGTNAIAKLFDWLGEAFERLGPAAFRFLAAVLPYATPYPVAILTSNSAVRFLNFDRTTAFVLVFGLEGIGLWFTSLLVDSVVEAIRSKSLRAWIMVLLFSLAIGSYITILVNLNVVLESTLENPNPALSKVITLLCFLPLLTGIGNGYYKLQLSYQYKSQEALEHQRAVEKEDKERASLERLEKARIKAGNFPKSVETFQSEVETFQKVSNATRKFPEIFYNVSSWRKLSEQLSENDYIFLASMTPHDMEELATEVGKEYRTISNWKNNAQEKLNGQ